MNTSRQVEHWSAGQATQDGAGVKLTRVLSSQWHQRLDPWLMLDEFGSNDANDYLAGFPPHPHRGFETITYMRHGRMRHKDNRGNEGVVEAGGMQWMTAGSGIIHEEMPAQESGRMQGFQFWLNLPKALKGSSPSWQDVVPSDLVQWQESSLSITLLAGELLGRTGALMRKDTQPLIANIAWQDNQSQWFELPIDHHAFIYVYQGKISIAQQAYTASGMAILSDQGSGVMIVGEANTRLLLVSGKPLNEPIAAGDPFVMNNKAELEQAFNDYRNNRF